MMMTTFLYKSVFSKTAFIKTGLNAKQDSRQCHSKNWRPVLMSVSLYFLIGCTSTQTAHHNLNHYYPSAAYTNRPISNPAVNKETHNFAKGNFPLGIGTKLDVAVSENPVSGNTAVDFYNDTIKPLRHGKILSRTPVEMNYSIMPSSGEAFFHRGGLDNGTIKSSYSFQIGMSRHVYKASDFFNTDFWLAKGKYNPNKVEYTYKDGSELNPFRDIEEIDSTPLQDSEHTEQDLLNTLIQSNQ